MYVNACVLYEAEWKQRNVLVGMRASQEETLPAKISWLEGHFIKTEDIDYFERKTERKMVKKITLVKPRIALKEENWAKKNKS